MVSPIALSWVIGEHPRKGALSRRCRTVVGLSEWRAWRGSFPAGRVGRYSPTRVPVTNDDPQPNQGLPLPTHHQDPKNAPTGITPTHTTGRSPPPLPRPTEAHSRSRVYATGSVRRGGRRLLRSASTDSSVFVGAEAAPGTLSERWQLLGLRGENSGSDSCCGAWSPAVSERTPRFGGGRDGRVALLLRVWFFRDRLGGVKSRKPDRRGGEIRTRAACLRFRLQLDHVPRDC